MSPKTTPRAAIVSWAREADEDTGERILHVCRGTIGRPSENAENAKIRCQSAVFEQDSGLMAHFSCGSSLEMCIIRYPNGPHGIFFHGKDHRWDLQHCATPSRASSIGVK